MLNTTKYYRLLTIVIGTTLVWGAAAGAASAAMMTNGPAENGLQLEPAAMQGNMANGISRNGIRINGQSLNGKDLNGRASNGVAKNRHAWDKGRQLQGANLNGWTNGAPQPEQQTDTAPRPAPQHLDLPEHWATDASGLAAPGIAVTTVTLPGGAAYAVR